MPKFILNDQEVEAQPGQMIIQAAEDHGVEIPHYCYHPDLPIDGNCRMCLVEVEKMPKLTPACTTVVSEGMVVRSANERVKTAVRGVLEFLLINHPVDCPVCDQAGECRLQDYYMVYGLHTSEIAPSLKVRKSKAVDLGPVMLDQERCVECSRCVRFFETVTKTGELQFFGRGDHVRIGTIGNAPLDNPYSGNVAEICPVGALTDHDFRFKARVWFLHSTDSVCGGCSTGCNARLDHRDGTLFRMQARRNLEVNRSWLCDEGRYSFHELERGERVLYPLVKDGDGAQSQATWDEAARSVDARLKEIAGSGASAILGFASPSAGVCLRAWRARDGRPAAAASNAIITFHTCLPSGLHRKIRLHRHDGEHRRRRRDLWIQHATVSVGVERDRRIVIFQSSRDQNVLIALPRCAVCGHGQVDLERDRVLRCPGNVFLGHVVFECNFAQPAAAVCSQECLELQLVLAIRRGVELCLEIGPERGVLQPLRDHARESFRSLRGCRERRSRDRPVVQGWGRDGCAIDAGGDENERRQRRSAVRHMAS